MVLQAIWKSLPLDVSVFCSLAVRGKTNTTLF